MGTSTRVFLQERSQIQAACGTKITRITSIQNVQLDTKQYMILLVSPGAREIMADPAVLEARKSFPLLHLATLA